MYKKIVLFALAVFGFNFLYGILNSVEASAYTASLTVPSTTVIDVAAVGNSANVTASNIVVDSTCPLGYTVSIAGPTDNTLYRNGDKTESYTIPASSGTLENPTSILGDNIGTWGYTMESNATINSNFAGLTNTMTDIVTKGSGSASGGDTIPVYFGVSVPETLIPGDYTLAESSAGAGDNAITYLLTPNANCSTIKMTYNDNGANSPTTMSITHTVAEDDVVTLAASNYQRPGYGFAGWSLTALDADAATFKSDLATAKTNGDVFGPNEDITINSHVLSKVTVINNELIIPLYAIWVKAETGVTFQTWTGCGAMNVGEVTALKDARDNDVYAVAKLADDNCWMIENLRLDYDADFTESLSQGFGKSTTYGNFIGLAEPETADFSDSTTANSIYYSGTQSGDASINVGATTSTYPGYRFPRYHNGNTSAPETSMSIINSNVHSYGNYYTWSAALANTIFYSNPTAIDDAGKTSETVGTSICPAGWRLPYGRNTGNGSASGGFSYLDVKMGGTGTNQYTAVASLRWRTYPNNFIYSGNINNNTVNDRGGYGYYLTSTAYSGNISAYNFYLYKTSVRPGTFASIKSLGLSIRCISSQYSIAFDANGGSGTMNDQTAILDVATTLDSSTLTAPTGKVFDSWNTAADGSGTRYVDGASVTNLTISGNTITLYAQWVCGGAGGICYNDNGANSPTTMGRQTVGSSVTEITLWASNFQRSGYGFAGWNTAADGSGTNYGPNETIDNATVLSTIQSAGLTLYANWIQSAGNLQSWNGCSSLSSGAVTALTDTRDGDTYAVAKLADGKCWMIENLRLDYDANITASNTQSNNGVFGGVFTGLAEPEITNFSGSTTANTLYSTDGTTANVVSGNNQNLRFPRYRNDNTNSDESVNSNTTIDVMTDLTQNVYSYGNYYTWAAAIADTNDHTNNNQSVTSTSICPTGWKLPRGGDKNGLANNDYWNLVVVNMNSGVLPANYSSSTYPYYTGSSEAGPISKVVRSYPNNFLYTGLASGSNISFKGNHGHYWTSTPSGNRAEVAYYFSFRSSSVGPGAAIDFKYYGFSVRCVVGN